MRLGECYGEIEYWYIGVVKLYNDVVIQAVKFTYLIYWVMNFWLCTRFRQQTGEQTEDKQTESIIV